MRLADRAAGVARSCLLAGVSSYAAASANGGPDVSSRPLVVGFHNFELADVAPRGATAVPAEAAGLFRVPKVWN